MICDGDSKSYNAIWNFYGVCGLSKKTKNYINPKRKINQIGCEPLNLENKL